MCKPKRLIGVNSGKEILSYGGASQNPNITSTLNNNKQLQLEGNAWKRLDITGYQVDVNTNLEFEFRSNGKGEIQGIGFDNNTNIRRIDDGGHFFQVDGSQSWGIEDLNQYIIGQSDGFDQYSIPIGNFFSGQFNYLTIANDHDVANPTAVGEFRNIALT
ncbi:MAG: hypothetical protein VKN72_25240 [Nostocales cyanobacterium 94392]|nr:hypothetical protein [Nostocales cyanobacterium 94392]